jgi:hypothetical protein
MQIRPRQGAPLRIKARIEVRGALQKRALHPGERIEHPAHHQKLPRRAPEREVDPHRDRLGSCGQCVLTLEPRSPDAAEGAERGLGRGQARVHLGDMRDARRPVEARGLGHEIEPGEPVAPREEERVEPSGFRGVDEPREEAEAARGRHHILAREMRDLDFPAPRIGTEPDERPGPSAEVERPALGEEPAALGMADDLHETVGLRHRAQEARDEGMARARGLGRRCLGDERLGEHIEERRRVGAALAHECDERVRADLGLRGPVDLPDRRLAPEPTPAEGRMIEDRDAAPVRLTLPRDRPDERGPVPRAGLVGQHAPRRRRGGGALEEKQRATGADQDDAAARDPRRRRVGELATVRSHQAAAFARRLE